ncbi:MAG TPA: RNA polymerase sigma factor [Fulvivirga sp.]|nr:RNA polymerase sigma factor [Fulvivirga sp.]
MEALKIHDYGSSKMQDAVVINRVLSGEKELYEILLRRYNQTLYRAVRSYLKEDEVEDTMQDTYIKAYQKLDQFKGDSLFSTWLIRIGINEALQRIRKKKRSHIVSLNQPYEQNDKVIQLPDTNTMNPEKQIINSENRQLLERSIVELPEKYRVVYMLREVEGMDNAEIANCLSLSESNVKVRLHRAKNLLKESLFKFSSETTVFEFGDKRCDCIVNNVMQLI